MFGVGYFFSSQTEWKHTEILCFPMPQVKEKGKNVESGAYLSLQRFQSFSTLTHRVDTQGHTLTGVFCRMGYQIQSILSYRNQRRLLCLYLEEDNNATWYFKSAWILKYFSHIFFYQVSRVIFLQPSEVWRDYCPSLHYRKGRRIHRHSSFQGHSAQGKSPEPAVLTLTSTAHSVPRTACTWGKVVLKEQALTDRKNNHRIWLSRRN